MNSSREAMNPMSQKAEVIIIRTSKWQKECSLANVLIFKFCMPSRISNVVDAEVLSFA